MLYILLFILLFLSELFYFKIADRYNIIDKPNERSSHTQVTLRGGGIIFYLGIVFYFFLSGYAYPYFFLGLSLMTLVSFLDDILDLSNKIRLSVHLVSVLLMAQELALFSLPWPILLLGFVVVIGVVNAYNFMDGINGITAAYSLAVLVLLQMVNAKLSFIDPEYLIISMLSTLVFAFFNFRTKAKCFAGDVGSVAMAFILLFALAKLILTSGNLLYILFLSVYGMDTVWTIIRRILRKENIFKAHRSHLYQFLGNEAGFNKLSISAFYGVLQLGIGSLVIYFSNFPASTQIVFAIVLLTSLSVLYLLVKQYIIKKYVSSLV